MIACQGLGRVPAKGLGHVGAILKSATFWWRLVALKGKEERIMRKNK